MLGDGRRRAGDRPDHAASHRSSQPLRRDQSMAGGEELLPARRHRGPHDADAGVWPMFALCWFLRWPPPEQGEPRTPVAIDGASAWHRETLPWRRRYYLFSIAVLALVVMEMLWCVAAVAQERPGKGKMSKEQELTSVRALENPTKKEHRAEPPQHNGMSIQIQTEDIMKYLLENRGKVTLYSGMHGKFHVELGLFGYLGLKYKF